MKLATAHYLGKVIYAWAVGWLCVQTFSSLWLAFFWSLSISTVAYFPVLFVKKEEEKP